MRLLKFVTFTLTLVLITVSFNAQAVSSKRYNKKVKKFEEEITSDFKAALDEIVGAGKYVMDAVDIDKRDDGGRNLQANIQLFEKENITLSGAHSPSKRIEFLEIEFPEGTTIDFKLIDDIVGGDLKSYLPDGFPLAAGVWVKNLSFKFGTSGYKPTNLSATIASPSNWELLGAGSFSANGVELNMEIENPKNASPTVTGTVTATAGLGNIPMEISSTLSNDMSNSGISAQIEQLNLKNMLDATIGNESSSFLALTPDVFHQLELSKATIDIYPTAKALTVTGESSMGNIIFDVGRKSGAQKIMLAIRPPSTFKFSSLSSFLAALDDMDMSGSHFVISDKQRTIPATFFDEKADENAAPFNVKKGFNLATSIELPKEAKDLLKVSDVTLVGSIPITLNAIDLYGELGLDLSLGDDDAIKFDNIGAGLGLSAMGDIELSLYGAGSFKAGDDRVEIYGGLIGSVAKGGMTLELEAGLAAGGRRAEKPESCLEPQAEWKEPFGIPGTGIRALGLRGGVGTTFPYINTLGLTGSLRLGTVSNQSKHICGSLVAYTNLTDLAETMLVAEVQNLTPLAFIEAFEEDADISGALRDALDTGIESAKLKIVPKEIELFGRTYSPGIALDSARLKLAGLEGLIGFSIGESGISAYGQMDPYEVKEGDFTFFAIRGKRPNPDGSTSGPSISLGLNADDPHFELNAAVEVLEIEAETFIRVDKNGFEFEVEGNVLDGALGVTAHIKAGEFTEDSGLYAKVAFKNELQTMVADALLDFIEEQSAEAQKAYQDAQKVLAEAETNNDFEQFWVDAASETVGAFAEMDRGMAVAGSYVVEGLLKDALNIRKISFEGEVTSMKAKVEIEIDMTIAGSDLNEKVELELDISEDMFVDLIVDAIGEDVIDFFGTLDTEIANAFEDLGAELEEAFEDLGGYIVEGAEIIGETFEEAAVEVGEAFVDLGGAFEDAGEYMAVAFEAFGKELENVFVGNSYAPSISSGGGINIPYNHTLVTVMVDNIRVTDDEGDLWDDDLELYGNVVVSVSSNMVTNNGATPFTWGKPMTKSVSVAKGSSTSIGNTKYFYVPNTAIDAGNCWVQLTSRVFEYNSNVDYDQLKGSSYVYLNSSSGSLSKSFTAKETRGNDEAVSISYRVIVGERKGPPPPPPSRDQMIAAAKTSNINEVNYLISKGGNIKIENIIDESIKSNVSAAMIQRLMQGGNLAKSNHITLALQPNFINKDIVRVLMQNGVRPNENALSTAVSNANLHDMVPLLLQNKAEAQLKHVKQAVQMDNLKMIYTLMNASNVQVGTAELDYAINKNDYNLAKFFISRSAKPSAASITKAIELHNMQMIDLLLQEGEADHTALTAAARKNDAGLFKVLIQNRVRLNNNEAINIAIDKNNLEILKLGLENGGSKTTALDYAISRSHKNAMMIALEKGANGTPALDYAVNNNDANFFSQLVNNFNADKNTGFAKAYEKNKIQMGETALKAGANPSNKIADASTNGKIDWVKLMLAKKANPQLGIEGAVLNNHFEVSKLLVDAGATAKAANLIATAAKNKNLPLVKLLVEDADAIAENGRVNAIANNDIPMTTYLLDKGAKPTGVDLPARSGWYDMVYLLVERGANPNEGIASAIEVNHTKIGVYLLDKGADVKDYIKTSAYHGNEVLVRKLLDKGANPNDGTFNSVKYKHVNILSILIDAGADVSGADLMNQAVKYFHEDLIVLLLKNDGDKAFIDKKGLTYLHRVSDKKGQQNLVSIFLAEGLEVDARNKDGQTPLHLAVRSGKGNIESVKLLIDAGADVNAKTKKGKSVLKRCNNKPVKELLIQHGAQK